jgi:YfiH family protein
VDPVRRVAGLSHSGWRGTVGNIAAETVRVMQESFGCDPHNIIAAIGPSICQDCYEVSEDVIEQFSAKYPHQMHDELFYRKENGRYQLNLWNACRENLKRAGIVPSNIQTTDICTCCNPGVLFSHRASKGRRGTLAAFLGIRG